MNYSTNYKFNLPTKSDNADIDYISENFTKIDSVLKENKSAPTDQTYNPESTNPQSGIAVAQAVDKVSSNVDVLKNTLKQQTRARIYIEDFDVGSIDKTTGKYLSTSKTKLVSRELSSKGYYTVRTYNNIVVDVVTYDTNGGIAEYYENLVPADGTEHEYMFDTDGPIRFLFGISGDTDIDNDTDKQYIYDKAKIYTTIANMFNNIEAEIDVDNAMSSTSKNPVQNKVVKEYIDNIMKGSNKFTDELKNALTTYFTNVQTLLTQLVYVAEDNIGDTLTQNAKDIVSVLEQEPTEEPETPTDKTLVGISANYTGGNVIVGKNVSSLTGVTVIATYDDGTTTEVTNYTLSGKIAEGENTITVTYEGLTTTFVVIGVITPTDENAVNIYTGFLGMDSTIDSEPVTNTSYPNAVCSDVIPVEHESTTPRFYSVKLNSNIIDTSKINWKTYVKETGVRHSSINGDTINAVNPNYSVRLNILDQTATADGSNAIITGFTITVLNSTGGVIETIELGVNDLRG